MAIKNAAHKGFQIGMIIKGIDGILEILGGFLLIFLNPARLSKLVVTLTQHELSEDPQDAVARFLINLSSHFSITTQYFSMFYLISHGLVKLILVVLLLRKKLWAYPLTIVSLILFILYQIYRCTFDYSTSLVVLTVFDTVMILLTFIEYKRMKLEYDRHI